MNPRAKFRKYREEDRNSVLELWNEVFPDNPPHSTPVINLDNKLAFDDLVFVGSIDDDIVAACMAGYDGHRGWLWAVATAPGYRKAGIASELVHFVVDELRNMGCIKVNIQIRSGNTEVISFYQGLGFAIEERVSMAIHLTGHQMNDSTDNH